MKAHARTCFIMCFDMFTQVLSCPQENSRNSRVDMSKNDTSLDWFSSTALEFILALRPTTTGAPRLHVHYCKNYCHTAGAGKLLVSTITIPVITPTTSSAGAPATDGLAQTVNSFVRWIRRQYTTCNADSGHQYGDTNYGQQDPGKKHFFFWATCSDWVYHKKDVAHYSIG